MIYVNSKEINKVKGKGKLMQDWAGRTEIGSCNGHYPFTGLLDDFVIYTIALDLKTISELSCTCSMKSGKVYDAKFKFYIIFRCHYYVFKPQMYKIPTVSHFRFLSYSHSYLLCNHIVHRVYFAVSPGPGAESQVTEQCHRGPKPSTPPPTKATSKVLTTLPPPTEAPPTKAPPSTPAPQPVPPSTPAPALPSGPSK